ncbi:hypothetical protein CR513_25550, partial [Mucuna pruriens]
MKEREKERYYNNKQYEGLDPLLFWREREVQLKRIQPLDYMMVPTLSCVPLFFKNTLVKKFTQYTSFFVDSFFQQNVLYMARCETTDILCSHALKVFETNDVKVVLKKYILKRWTKEGRGGIIHDIRGKEVEEDPRLSSTRRYQQLASKMINIDVVCKKIKELRLHTQSVDKHNGYAPTLVVDDGTQPKGFKQQHHIKRIMIQESVNHASFDDEDGSTLEDMSFGRRLWMRLGSLDTSKGLWMLALDVRSFAHSFGRTHLWTRLSSLDVRINGL